MISAAILGATGTVGQKLVALLENHPQFEVRELVASERSAGKSYREACKWKQAAAMPSRIADMKVLDLTSRLASKVLFSGLDSSVAFEAEARYAEAGHVVISNAKNHRMEKTVPLVIPEINHEHIRAINTQPYHKRGGAIITNPNCSTIGLALALAPLARAFGLEKIMVHTMQAVSGAGYPGVPSLDILGNVIPFIGDEEEKLETETKKILGGYDAGSGFTDAPFAVSAHCNRVAVIDGHTECVSVSFAKRGVRQEDIIAAWDSFAGFPQQQKLHSAPARPTAYLSERDRPQPLLDAAKEGGMAVSIGRLRPCALFDYKFVLLSHNTVRGAAGAAILNGETALAMNALVL